VTDGSKRKTKLMNSMLTELLGRMSDEDLNSYVADRIDSIVMGQRGSPRLLAVFWRESAARLLPVLDAPIEKQQKTKRPRLRLEGQSPAPSPGVLPPAAAVMPPAAAVKRRQEAPAEPEEPTAEPEEPTAEPEEPTAEPAKRRGKQSSLSPDILARVKGAISAGCGAMSEILMKTGLSKAHARAGVEALVESGVVGVTGSKRWTRYALNNGTLPKRPAPDLEEAFS
jgi:hypothetical protein